jgi:2-desacetyl-2-hydroxyethyl bacteriochlorophyllide A dehydrogenase
MTQNMKAAVLRGIGELEVLDVPVFAPRYDEFLLRVKACGVCGSDIRYFKGENPWSFHTLGYEQENPPNMILGHEFSGDIVAEGIERDPGRIGERVSVEPYRSCGECYYCKIGKHNICADQEHHGHDHGWRGYEYAPGGMAEYTPAWRSHTYTLPDNISYDEATFIDGLAVAVRAVELGGIVPGSELLVIGGGPIGLLIAQAAKGFGANRVFLSDVYDKPLQVAEQLGVDDVIDSRKENVSEYVLGETGGLGVGAAYDSTGSEEAILNGLRSLQRGGNQVLLAGYHGTLSLKFPLISGDRSIRSLANNPYRNYQTALDLMKSGRADVKPMITHTYPLSEINEAFDIVTHKEENDAIKVIIHP